MDLPQIVAHGRSSLRLAELAIAGHTPDTLGLCSCLRPLPCHVRAEWDAQADHWRGKLADLEGRLSALTGRTAVLPVLAAGSHPRMR